VTARGAVALVRASLRLGVSLVLAYRLEVIVQIASASIVALLNWSLWTAIYQGRDEIAGRTATEMTTYVVVAWIVTTFYGNQIDRWLGARFRTGALAIDLLRPWSLQAHLYLRDLGRAGMSLMLTTAPLFIWTQTLLPLQAPKRAIVWAAFGVSLLLAHAISFGFSWLVGVASFRLRNAAGLTNLKATIISIFSGALIPLDLYPAPLRAAVMWMPFQGLSHTPANIFIETIPIATLWQPLLVQAGWAVLLAVLGALAFRRATQQLVIQGG
jgi:ABC-2 type transport system permease protein